MAENSRGKNEKNSELWLSQMKDWSFGDMSINSRINVERGHSYLVEQSN